ncbi:ExeM/NucH family extracellular endonuclease [Actinobaculum sp. 313]|uniref:ExeM/NucH family extracellular endonuclease n=1 Tax=Actinobaculum sp. 313 TaxID=2495645 RepID=UPI000F7400C3|nr:ExeM/NucH family extracellular endonuclease [Actinobaculum sp. 313]
MRLKRLSRAAVLAVAGAMVAVPLVTVPASATPAGDAIVINEVYARGGSANAVYKNKFVELYNPTDAEIDLAGLKLQQFSTAGKAGSSVDLAGTVAPQGYFLIQLGSNGNTGGELPTPDLQATNVQPGGTAGGLGLLQSTASITVTGNVAGQEGVVDFVGWGTSPLFEGAAATSTGSNTTPLAWQRNETGVDTDSNLNDFSMVSPSPQNAAGEGPSTEPTDEPSTDPTTDPASEITPIADIQGSGAQSPLVGKTVTTRGVVTAVYPTGGFNGAYIQTPGTGGTNDDGISDGVFAYGSAFATAVQIGDYVEVTGSVTEYNGLTEINVNAYSKVDEQVEAPTPVTLERIPADEQGKEALEGMLVEVAGPLTVTDNYSTNRYGQIGLAFGTEPLRQPSDKYNPSENPDEIAALTAENEANKITLDDGISWQYTGSNSARTDIPVPYISLEEPMRVGAAVTLKQPMILDYRFQWNLQPTGPVTGVDGDRSSDYVSFSNTRTEKPSDVGGDITLSSFNVLNYFTDLGENEAGCKGYADREGNLITTNNCDVRGAYRAADFERQQEKIVAAINSLDSSVLSLEEIETSSRFGHERDESLAALVDALNADAGYERWAYVPSAANLPANEDVIRLAFIYQKAQVKPVGESQVLVGEAVFTGLAREPLAQRWQALDADGNGYGEEFVVVVNHFKSKGSLSSYYPNDTDTYQGNNNKLRVSQAEALAKWVDSEFTDVPVFLVGDFNAYTAEDPMRTLQAAGYTDVALAQGVTDYSYQYSGLVGSLDHVMANESALAMVTGADVWNINAMESIALEYSRYNYNVKQLYDASPYRSSDHDPVKVGLKITSTPEDPNADAKPIADECIANGSCNLYFSNDFATSKAELGMKVQSGDEVLVGDWDGDGIDTPVVRSGNKYIFYATNRSDSETWTINYGRAGDQALVGDFDGNGKDELAVKRGNTFYLAAGTDQGGAAARTVSFGRASDVGMVGDWDGDGVDTVGVRRGALNLLRDDFAGGAATTEFVFGRATDTPLVADFDGDGKDGISVVRNNTVLRKDALTGGNADAVFAFGSARDVLLAGDWDGDGSDSVAAYRR